MQISYNRLFKLLIDKGMKKTDLAKEAKLTPATLAKLSKQETVSMDTLIRICDCWDCSFDDVVEFNKNHGGLISIHAGKKTNGIDKEISNALPVKEAIKADIAQNVDFFEVGKKKDVEDYCKYVFKEMDEKPVILCSDCHDPRKYSTKDTLWIKANLTFEGLKQCIFHPFP